MKIPIVNPTTFLKEHTYLTSAYTSGTTLSVVNSDKFSDNDIVLVGAPGQERSETTDLTATPPSTTSLTVTALDFAHPKDTPIYLVDYDQAVVYKSSDGSSYSILDTINLNFNKKITIYEDTTGTTTDYYKIKLKNSASGGTTNFSDAQTGSGWPKNSIGRMVRNVRRGLRDLKQKNFEDWEIMEQLRNAADDVLSEIPNAYWTLRSESRTTTDGDYDYYLPENYRAMLYLLYTYEPNATNSQKYPLRYMPKSEWQYRTQDQNATDDDYLDGWTELPGDTDYPNGYFGLYPTPGTTGEALELWYFIEEPAMDSYGDLVNCPMPQVYEYYAINALTDDDDVQGKMQAKYNRGVEQLKKRQRREFSPKELRRQFGRHPNDRLYGRAAVRRTASEQENYW